MSKFEELEDLWQRHSTIKPGGFDPSTQPSQTRVTIRIRMRKLGVRMLCKFGDGQEIATINGCIMLSEDVDHE